MSDSISLSIVKALARTENVEPEGLDYTLEACIDTDVMAQLAAHETASWTLSFQVPDHEVTVRSDGLILVDGRHEETWDKPHTFTGQA